MSTRLPELGAMSAAGRRGRGMIHFIVVVACFFILQYQLVIQKIYKVNFHRLLL